MQVFDAALLALGGLAAGAINTLAGGGSLLTVPLLGITGLPLPVANGTNRVGVLLGSATATWRLAAEGAPGLREAAPLLVPTALGALVGARLVVELPAEWFERIFGVVMLVLLVPTLRSSQPPPASAAAARAAPPPRAPLSPAARFAAFAAIGVYGGAFQAGVGILLITVLSLSGVDLVRSTQIKTALNTCFTLLTLPVFYLAGQIAWAPALVLGAGFAAGAALGARLAVRGGARVIRPVLAVAVVALAGRMLGLY
ncbi:MAG TPA: sulfite exporter TauE/SafE family protein [Myxococcota bacterium]|nr:sulfite exporter TauE/SafE family protein [Myxococcota bacterium]